METKDAIRRLTNLAQEKNANWLGLTNIEAMEVILKEFQEKENLINKLIFRIATIEGKDFEDIRREYE